MAGAEEDMLSQGDILRDVFHSLIVIVNSYKIRTASNHGEIKILKQSEKKSQLSLLARA